jgi:hypothetical protein
MEGGMAVKCEMDAMVRIQSVEEAELIVADMERVIRELKATIELIKKVTPGDAMETQIPGINRSQNR